jgi:hypothetical protein
MIFHAIYIKTALWLLVCPIFKIENASAALSVDPQNGTGFPHTDGSPRWSAPPLPDGCDDLFFCFGKKILF